MWVHLTSTSQNAALLCPDNSNGRESVSSFHVGWVLLSTVTPKMAKPLNTVYLTWFAARQRAQHCLPSRPQPSASFPCQSRSTMAHLFSVNIKPTLTLSPHLLPSLSLHFPVLRYELGLGIVSRMERREKTQHL